MREKSSVDSLFLTRTGFVEFFVVFVKLIHGLTAVLPAMILLFYRIQSTRKCVATTWACCCFLRS